jgi:hypothetical protein
MNIHWIATADLSFADREEMYLLSSIHFELVNRQAFDDMLDAKTWVLLLRDSQTHFLTAFVPLCFYQEGTLSECCVLLDSNEVVADPEVWPGIGLASAWVAVMNSLRRLCAPTPVHWVFLCGHPRIYSLLNRFWQCIYPGPGRAIPPGHQGWLRSHLPHPEHYDAGRNVLRASPGPRPRHPVPPLAEDSLESSWDEHSAFFVTQNPRYDRGDRLVCWIDINQANLTPQGRRYSQPRQAAQLKAMSQQMDSIRI